MGKLLTFGNGSCGQLGHSNTNARESTLKQRSTRRPSKPFPQSILVDTPKSRGGRAEGRRSITHRRRRRRSLSFLIVAGLRHNNEEDQLKEVAGGLRASKAIMLAAGHAHTMVLTHDVALWGCGSGHHGQLGVGNSANRLTLVRVGLEEAFRQSGMLMVGHVGAHTMGLTKEGGLWSWGEGARGMLGHNNEEDRLVQVRAEVEGQDGDKIMSSDHGDEHSAEVTEDGALYT